MAAIAIPAMTGWIKKADEGRAIAEARSLLVAASALYASGEYTTDAALEMAGNPKGDYKGVTYDPASGKITAFEYVYEGYSVTLGALQ